MVKSHQWLVDSTKLVPIWLATGEDILDSMFTAPIVLCDFSGHAAT